MAGSSSERIAFVRMLRDLGEQVFTMEPDRTDLRQLTGGPGQGANYAPCWSPDGGRVCFVSRRDGYGSLYVMNRDGSQQERLTTAEGVDDDFPAWSPDGRTIAFSRGNRVGADDLWLLDLDTPRETQLTHLGLMDYSPSWSPEGTHIAFRRSLTSPAGIYALSVTGGEARFVTPGGSPSWSWARGEIAYAYHGGLWRLPVDRVGTPIADPVRLTGDADTEDDRPCWSPHGRRLAFERTRQPVQERVCQIVTLDVASGATHELIEGSMPAWSGLQRRHVSGRDKWSWRQHPSGLQLHP